jgi:hypothetical protein
MGRPHVTGLFEDEVAHDPGGLRAIPLQPGVESEAQFSPCGLYRYWLYRGWDKSKPQAIVVMMNPSMADARVDDPSVAKVQRMARRWGMGAVMIGNVFAYRSTDQAGLGEVSDPVGADNDRKLMAAAELVKMGLADRIVFAYGRPKLRVLQDRGPHVARMIADLIAPKPVYALRVGKGGHPWHPLYLPDATVPEPWTPPGA